MSYYDILLAKQLSGGGGGGDITVESLSVTANGTYSAPSGKAYSPVVANVPNSYTASDEGKVVSSGALVAQTSQTIDTNGTYDTTLKNSVTVNVSGGGSFTPTFGVIRPDAELVNKWTYDDLLVEDLEITLPAYTTSAKQLYAPSAETQAIDRDNYRYFLMKRLLAIPVKSQWVHETGAFDYAFCLRYCEIAGLNNADIKSVDGTLNVGTGLSDYRQTIFVNNNTYEYPSGEGVVKLFEQGSATTGLYFQDQADTISSGNLSIKTPKLYFKGSANQYSSADWERTTDIRLQRIYELYRVPVAASDLDGWSMIMNRKRIMSAIANGGTLT